VSNHSVVEHRASYYYIRIEEDFLAICSRGEHSPHCKALILAILEHWMNTKRDKGESEYVYLTMPQWIKHTYMLYARNVITDCIRELIAEKLVNRRPIKVHDQNTFEYTLNLDVLNARLKALLTKQPKETMPSLDAYIAFKNRAKVKRSKNKADREGVSEKSRTSKSSKRVSEKSRTVGDKSQGVGDKSTQHSIPTYSSFLDSDNTTTDASASSQQQPSSQNEINLSSLSEQEKSLYSKLRKQYQPIYLAWSPEDRSKYVHWIYSFDDIIPLDITDGVIEELRLLRGVQTSPEMFRDLREWKLEQERRENKHYYADRGFKLWDVHRELQNWKMSMPKAKSNTSKQNTDEINFLKGRIEDHTKHVGYGNTIKANLVMQDEGQVIKVYWHDERYAGTVRSFEDWKTIFVNNLICDNKLPEEFDKQMNEDTKFKDIFKAIAAYKEELNAIPV